MASQTNSDQDHFYRDQSESDILMVSPIGMKSVRDNGVRSVGVWLPSCRPLIGTFLKCVIGYHNTLHLSHFAGEYLIGCLILTDLRVMEGRRPTRRLATLDRGRAPDDELGAVEPIICDVRHHELFDHQRVV